MTATSSADLGLNSDGPSLTDGRIQRVVNSAREWERKLLNKSGQNTLLYYVDRPKATLSLDEANPQALDRLLRGETVDALALFPEEKGRRAAIGRATTIRRNTRLLREERGLETLFLALGLVSWGEKQGRPPAAPLVLLPAELASKGQGDRFTLTISGEPEINGSLLYHLYDRFQLHTPDDLPVSDVMRASPGGPTLSTAQRLEPILQRLEDTAQQLPGFRVEPRLVLGSFFHERMPMVRDLRGEEHLRILAGSDAVAALAGDGSALAALRTSDGALGSLESLDRRPVPEDYLVEPADASQEEVIAAALAGRSLILEGPPGTGKSRTIANLIATLVADGRKVLFVAEKRAAILAVVDGLRRVGLGDLAFDLHGRDRDRSALAAELRETFDRLGGARQVNAESVHRRLTDTRARLVRYASALFEERQPWGISFHEARLRLLDVPSAARIGHVWRGRALEQLSAALADEIEQLLRDYVDQGGLSPSAVSGPWASAQLTRREDAAAARDLAVRMARDTWPEVSRNLDRVLDRTGLPRPSTVSGWEHALALLERVGEVRQVLIADVWATDLDTLSARLGPAARGSVPAAWARLTSAAYREARRQVLGLIDGSPPGSTQLAQAIRGAAEVRRTWTAATASATADRGASPPVTLDGLDDVVAKYRLVISDLRALGDSCGRDLLTLDDDGVSEALHGLANDTTVWAVPELRRLEAQLASYGQGPLLQELLRERVPPELARQAFRGAWLASVLEDAVGQEPLLAAPGAAHDRAVTDFVAADRAHLELNPPRIQRLQSERVAEARDRYPSESGLVTGEANRRRKQMVMRQLRELAPHVLMETRPCWAMSPRLVASWLPLQPDLFDVVVFDEASQIAPEDAVGALARARQFVIAGDSRQLPPSDDFVRRLVEDSDEDDSATGTVGFDSILEALRDRALTLRLRWHYRSEDERLIALANREVYGSTLSTFPSAHVEDPITFEQVRTDPDMNETASSSTEAARVAELVLDHAERRPGESLGVIAMGLRHANAIDQALRLARRERPELSAFFDEGRREAFFVKNLETVQGDERDAVILSLGYRRDATGRLSHNFGPVSQDGGERRLNVAMTRAKRRMSVVAAFSAEEMDPDKLEREGPKLLRQLLLYAQRGGRLPEDRGPLPVESNAFERQVEEALRERGLHVIPQYGVSDYRVDLAIAHPQRPGQMILAIECDGDTYHRGKTARERDRLRTEVLQRFGWQVHRLWASDWFRDPEATTASLVEAYRQAIERVDAAPDLGERDHPPADDGLAAADALRPVRRSRWPHGVQRGLRPDAYTHDHLVRVAYWVRSDGLVRHLEQEAEEVARALEKRATENFTARARQAVTEARRRPP